MFQKIRIPQNKTAEYRKTVVLFCDILYHKHSNSVSMKKSIHLLRRPAVHRGNGCQRIHVRLADGFQGLKMLHQSFPSGRPNALDIIQNRMHLLLTSQGSMVLYGKAMCLILNPCNQPEALGIFFNGNLYIVVVKPSGTVIIIFHHAADRDRKVQLL